ncbi:hypothetical protein [Spongiactinospora sp. TRM90649]|uniref:hypothetical protein n=1 Tax=Spongiactinospora sp. TRM90649 TaxID=3031114 RepID=UPI0023F7096D|nr:hypothetical protein [Spongiactinospora sp. TRM90649]MDF5758409.1 hypothetical protein [Spongiactinospora sp. TRM90649]
MPHLREHGAEQKLARDLQRRAQDRWVVLWLAYHRVFIAFFCGDSPTAIIVEAATAESLWQLMLVRDAKLWSAVIPALTARGSRSHPSDALAAVTDQYQSRGSGPERCARSGPRSIPPFFPY